MLISIPGVAILAAAGVAAPNGDRRTATHAAVHPVADASAMNAWLARVPVTRDFPNDLAATLAMQRNVWRIDMTTGPDCLACGDLWAKLNRIAQAYGWEVGTISQQDAMMRSARLGLPWIGHPVAWARSQADVQRIIPIAIGTDHAANLTRNLYLAAKMLAGVRPAVGVRAMSKFTGIVGAPPRPKPER